MAPEVLERRQSEEASSDVGKEDCDAIRNSIASKLRSAMGGDSVLSERDVRDYMIGISDANMREGGAEDYGTQLKWLQENRDTYVPDMIRESRQFATRLHDALTTARSEGSLNTSNIEHLQTKLARRSGSWQEVKAFYLSETESDATLSGWRKNWSAISAKTKELAAAKARLNVTSSALPELQLAEATEKSGSVKDRLRTLDAALRALSAMEHGKNPLYTKARQAMQPSVHAGVMTAGQLERNMKRIFGKYSGKALETYVSQTLPARVRDWAADVKRFRTLSTQSVKAGLKPVSEDAFFSMDYGTRRSHIVKMQTDLRKAEVPEHHPILDQIRQRIDADDWKRARAMLDRTKDMKLSDTDRKQWFRLRQTVDANTHQSPQKSPQKPDEKPAEKKRRLEAELRDKLMHSPPSYALLYNNLLFREGPSPQKAKAARDLATQVWNVGWAQRNNFIKNENHLMKLKEGAVDQTERIKEEGHRKTGVQHMDVKEALRGKKVDDTFRQYGGKSRGADYKYLRKDEESVNAVIRDAKDQGGDRTHRYWGLLVAKDGTLEQTNRFINEVLPRAREYIGAEEQADRDKGAAMSPAKPAKKAPASETPLQMAA